SGRNLSATSLCPSSNPRTCGSPPTAADSSGQANHLTLTAPADFVVGRFATGVSDGCEAQTSCPAGIQGPAHGFPAGDTAITIEAWVRPGGAGFVDILHYSSSQGGQRSFTLQVRSPSGAPTVADFLWYGTPVSFGPVTNAPVFGD